MKFISTFLLLFSFSLSAFAEQITLNLNDSNVTAIVSDLIELEARVPLDPQNLLSYMNAARGFDSASISVSQMLSEANLTNPYYNNGVCNNIVVENDAIKANCFIQIGKMYLKNVKVLISGNSASYDHSPENFRKIVIGPIAVPN